MRVSLKQIFNFVLVGTLAFAVDYFILIILTEYARISYLIAAGLSFSISVIVNFLLSMRFVFKAKDKSTREQFVIFISTSVIGLVLNEIGLWIFVELLSIDYRLAKIVMAAIVMLFNFVTKKILYEKE